ITAAVRRSSSFDPTCKRPWLNETQVGKTSLMKRYAAGDFTDYRRPTIGADFMTKELVEGDQPILLQVNYWWQGQ
ncbi:unnamed protein product, partial [Hapterophycus canaliculatus]